jgi:hypothetical protein
MGQRDRYWYVTWTDATCRERPSQLTCVTDRPLTDLYETEGNGGFPGINFMARPVVGGHFAFLALERACGGKAVDGLRFLDEASAIQDVDVAAALSSDLEEGENEVRAGLVGEL